MQAKSGGKSLLVAVPLRHSVKNPRPLDMKSPPFDSKIPVL